jgi:hypothetical protein
MLSSRVRQFLGGTRRSQMATHRAVGAEGMGGTTVNLTASSRVADRGRPSGDLAVARPSR